MDTTNNSISFLDNRPINADAVMIGGLVLVYIASIEAILMVKVLAEGIDRNICLSNIKIGEKAKEMLCKHHFHSICIDMWLRINGPCPICRYNMSMNEQCDKKVVKMKQMMIVAVILGKIE